MQDKNLFLLSSIKFRHAVLKDECNVSTKTKLKHDGDMCCTSAFRASNTAPGTGSGQNSSGVKLQSIRINNGRLIDGHTCTTFKKKGSPEVTWQLKAVFRIKMCIDIHV